jgi:hypothetical protein
MSREYPDVAVDGCGAIKNGLLTMSRKPMKFHQERVRQCVGVVKFTKMVFIAGVYVDWTRLDKTKV